MRRGICSIVSSIALQSLMMISAGCDHEVVQFLKGDSLCDTGTKHPGDKQLHPGGQPDYLQTVYDIRMKYPGNNYVVHRTGKLCLAPVMFRPSMKDRFDDDDGVSDEEFLTKYLEHELRKIGFEARVSTENCDGHIPFLRCFIISRQVTSRRFPRLFGRKWTIWTRYYCALEIGNKQVLAKEYEARHSASWPWYVITPGGGENTIAVARASDKVHQEIVANIVGDVADQVSVNLK